MYVSWPVRVVYIRNLKKKKRTNVVMEQKQFGIVSSSNHACIRAAIVSYNTIDGGALPKQAANTERQYRHTDR